MQRLYASAITRGPHLGLSSPSLLLRFANSAGRERAFCTADARHRIIRLPCNSSNTASLGFTSSKAVKTPTCGRSSDHLSRRSVRANLLVHAVDPRPAKAGDAYAHALPVHKQSVRISSLLNGLQLLTLLIALPRPEVAVAFATAWRIHISDAALCRQEPNIQCLLDWTFIKSSFACCAGGNKPGPTG